MKTAVILAAGEGSKCWPYSPTRNKSVVPIANKPIIQWTIEALRAHGIENILIVTGYRKEQIAYAVGHYENIAFIEQKGGSGTVAALLSAWDVVEEESFLVFYGDVLVTSENVGALIDRANQHQPLAAALLQPLAWSPARSGDASFWWGLCSHKKIRTFFAQESGANARHSGGNDAAG